MALKAYSAFLPEVLPRAPATPDVVAINAVRNAAIEFCERSLVWVEQQDPADVTASSFPLDLSAPTGARVGVVLSAKVDGTVVPAKGMSDIDDTYRAWEGVQGAPFAYYQPTPDTLQLVLLPETTVALALRVAYVPTRASTGVETFIYENYLEGIAAGALYRLTGEAPYLAAFESSVRKAAVDAQKSFTIAALRVDLSGAR